MELYPAFHISPKLLEAAQRAEELARPQFAEIESIQRYNQQKMLAAFSKAGGHPHPHRGAVRHAPPRG